MELERFRERIRSEFEPLLNAYLETAKGSYVMFAVTSDGIWTTVSDEGAMARLLMSGERFYRLEKTKPDFRALKDIWDRLFGSPARTPDISPESNAGTTVVHFCWKEPEACPKCGYRSDFRGSTER